MNKYILVLAASIKRSIKKDELAKRYNASRTTLNKMLAKVPGYQVNKSWYITPKELSLIIKTYG